MVALFKVSPSNLHKLVSGKKYHGGSHGDSRKVSSLKDIEEHSETMVQVIRKKMVKSMTSGSGTSKSGDNQRAKCSGTSGKMVIFEYYVAYTVSCGHGVLFRVC